MSPARQPEGARAAVRRTEDGPINLLETRGLTLHAEARPLVQGLDWTVRAGERWCVIGRNGAGKSLLLRALAGLDVPRRAGAVLWQGRDRQAWPAADAAAARALMPQQAQDRFALSVERLLALSAVGPSGAEPAARAADLLAALDIAALAGRRADRLSGGERQRVALAQCVVQGAALMLLDEPVSFQDPAHRQRVGRFLAGAAAAGRAWIASAHDPGWIAGVATHVLALSGDGGWQAGTVDEMLAAPVLERTYGCAWREVGGAWLPV
jgi:iron complex transport system ATP-binding protein